jgi:hypothetical protein
VIQIDDRPLTDACATCNQPLDWVWRARDQRWYAIVRYPEVEDPTVVKLHTCPLIGVPRLWRNLQYQPAGVRSRGARKVRAVLAAKSKSSSKERHDERRMPG